MKQFAIVPNCSGKKETVNRNRSENCWQQQKESRFRFNKTDSRDKPEQTGIPERMNLQR
jgi:hypothetical protein